MSKLIIHAELDDERTLCGLRGLPASRRAIGWTRVTCNRCRMLGMQAPFPKSKRKRKPVEAVPPEFGPNAEQSIKYLIGESAGNAIIEGVAAYAQAKPVPTPARTEYLVALAKLWQAHERAVKLKAESIRLTGAARDKAEVGYAFWEKRFLTVLDKLRGL